MIYKKNILDNQQLMFLLELVLSNINILDKLIFFQFKVNVKFFNIQITLQAYRLLASTINQSLHIRVTASEYYVMK